VLLVQLSCELPSWPSAALQDVSDFTSFGTPPTRRGSLGKPSGRAGHARRANRLDVSLPGVLIATSLRLARSSTSMLMVCVLRRIG
jgi:hypothetical protein